MRKETQELCIKHNVKVKRWIDYTDDELDDIIERSEQLPVEILAFFSHEILRRRLDIVTAEEYAKERERNQHGCEL